MESVSAKNCPINERAGDGIYVGRCWMYLSDGKTCPWHGDVSDAVKHYKQTGHLTRERDCERKG